MPNAIPEKSAFLASKYLRLDYMDVDKKLMHHRRFIIKVTIENKEFVIKKKFDAIKKFLDICGKKIDFGELQTELRASMNIRTKKRQQICHKIFNKVNSLLKDPLISQQTINLMKENIYNFLQLEQLPSGDDDQKSVQQINPVEKKLSASSFVPSTSPTIIRKKTLPFQECWAKLQSEKQWQFYRIRIKDCLLILNEGNSDDYYYLKGCNVQVKTQPYYAIVLSHKFDENPLEIRIQTIPNLEEDDPDQQLYETYVIAYSFLKQLCVSKFRIDAEICGKYVLNFLWADINQKQKDKDSEVKQFFLKITHQKIEFTTGLYYLKKQLSLNLYIPLINPFGKLKIQMLTKSESWLHKDLVEVALGQVQLLMQEVLTASYQLQPSIYKIPLSVSSSDSQNKVMMGYLKCGFGCFSNLKSHFTSNELQIYQGDSIEPELENAREEIRMSGNRIKRILYNIQFFKIRVKQISYFKYPYESYFFYSLLIICLWMIQSLFRTVLLIFICVAIASNKNFTLYFNELINVLNLIKIYEILSNLFKIKNNNFLQPRAKFKKESEKAHFLANFQIKMKKGGNIFSKYKRFQQNLFAVRHAILIVVGTVQKLKNLLNWTQPKKTLIFCFFCILIFIFVGNFPIRYIMMIGLLAISVKNKGYYKRLYSYNRLLVYQILRITSNQQNGQFTDFRLYLKDPTKHFDFSKSFMGHFQKKAIQNFQNLTDIEVPNNLFIQNNSVNEIQNCLMTLPRRIRILKKYKRQLGLYDVHPSWFSDGSSSKMVANSLYSFLYNVPSDRYLLQYQHNWKLKKLQT